MKYRIEDCVLDERTRTLCKGHKVLHIRPKTLALLIYLAKNKGQILHKQRLLDNVWHDVKVDEGVIFQSVREIRQLFADQHIVQNHPRQGYEFTGSFSSYTAPGFRLKPHWLSFLIATLILTFSAILSLPLFTANHTKAPEHRYKHSILVLPVKNYVHYGQHDWVYLGAMEQLIGKLKGLAADILVHDGNYVLRLVHQTGLNRNFSSDDVIARSGAMGNNLVIETEVHGNVSDYKLVYKFHRQNDLEQGVILAESIDQALANLSEKIAEEFDSSLTPGRYTATKEFGDALFTQAMISYEQDWETSVSFFESYLVLQPDSVIAMVYLSKLYLWQNKPEKALVLMADAEQLIEPKHADYAHIQLIKGRVAAKQKRFQTAHKFYKSAADLLQTTQHWFLRANVAEEQGHAWYSQGNLNNAHRSFSEALRYFTIIRSPIGIHSSSLHLANIEFEQGHISAARERFLTTKATIETVNLEFLYSMLQDYEQKLSSALQTPPKFVEEST